MAKTIFKVVGMIVFALFTAITSWPESNLGIPIEPKFIPLGSFVIFCFFIGWYMVGQRQHINKLESGRPSIDVEPIKEQTGGGHICYLRVRNKGAEGMFRAQIELSSEDSSVDCLPQYNGYWEYSNKSETKILKGQDDLLKIAESVSSPPKYDTINLHIFSYNVAANLTSSISTSSYWIGATITSKDGSTRPMTKHDYKLRVTISSSPELKEGVFCQEYILNVDKLEMIK